jgi:hypothetical protein
MDDGLRWTKIVGITLLGVALGTLRFAKRAIREDYDLGDWAWRVACLAVISFAIAWLVISFRH